MMRCRVKNTIGKERDEDGKLLVSCTGSEEMSDDGLATFLLLLFTFLSLRFYDAHHYKLGMYLHHHCRRCIICFVEFLDLFDYGVHWVMYHKDACDRTCSWCGKSDFEGHTARVLHESMHRVTNYQTQLEYHWCRVPGQTRVCPGPVIDGPINFITSFREVRIFCQLCDGAFTEYPLLDIIFNINHGLFY